MQHFRSRGTGWLFCVLSTLGGAGCHTQTDIPATTILPTNAQVAEVPAGMWRRYGLPDMHLLDLRRVAIVDFSVEFVTARIEHPALVPTSPTVAAGITDADSTASRMRLNLKHADYDRPLWVELPDALHTMFVRELQLWGLEVVPTADMIDTHAYKRISTRSKDREPVNTDPNYPSSDAGRIKQVVTRSATDLPTVLGAFEAQLESIERELLDQTNADAAIRVRIRVGVADGKAVLERGSSIWLMRPGMIGQLTAERSVRSDSPVAQLGAEPIAGIRPYVVDSERYLEQMRTMFPLFIAVALDSKAAHPVPVR